MSATISECGTYRYQLTRSTGVSGPSMLYIMLNPSGDDEHFEEVVDDPTIVRCMGFAAREGFGSIEIVHLFGLRSTDLQNLHDYFDPVGPDNDRHVADACARADRIVVAWGAEGRHHPERVRTIDDIIDAENGTAYCLGLTKDGEPRHPLRLPGDTEFELWE